MVSLLKISIPNHVLEALFTGTRPEETYVIDGRAIAVWRSCSCESYLIPSVFGFEFEEDRGDFIAFRSDSPDGFSIPDDLELAGG